MIAGKDPIKVKNFIIDVNIGDSKPCTKEITVLSK
jgi:hypothetical protein